LNFARVAVRKVTIVVGMTVFWKASDDNPQSSSSSSSLAQQPILSQGLLLKLLPAVPVPRSIPPISLPQLPCIFLHIIICNDFDLYKDKTFHEPILRSLNRFTRRRILDSSAIASLDFSTTLFYGAGDIPQ
jgi:hypothetical protein